MPAFEKPIELLPIFRERVWGRESLEPFFRNELSWTAHNAQQTGLCASEPKLRNEPTVKRIGEAWFTFEENATSTGKKLGELLRNEPGILGSGADPRHPGICPILLKLLFTTERLSVQVHPDDDYAREHHQGLGKTEAWYVVDAQPPGELAVGFRRQLSPEEFRRSIENGEIEDLLDWRKVHPGEVVFVPAGTVHAIGAGLTICEIQENSDITYRLYDYGRPRELHVEHGARVSAIGPHHYETNPIGVEAGRDRLVVSRYFTIERLRPNAELQIPGGLPYYSVLICLKGEEAGRAWLIPAGSQGVAVGGSGSEWIWTY